ncbi:MAG: hypothetical protein Q8P24_15805 [Desulfobacterales bacterium]|nr:hypothetical protein [Desulfobacterales bacterium]
MFELSAVGLPLAVLGITLIYIAAPYVMPGNAAPTCDLNDRADMRYLSEFQVSPDSKLIGQNPVPFFAEKYPSFELFEVIRGARIYYPDREEVVIAPMTFCLSRDRPTTWLRC